MTKMLDRFLKYVSFETTSDEASGTCPSTDRQLSLGNYLVEELSSLGIESEITLSDESISSLKIPFSLMILQ